jgi:hypothetical protein
MTHGTPPPHLEALLDLEARHDELLDRLDELDDRVSKTLAECAALRDPAATDTARRDRKAK